MQSRRHSFIEATVNVAIGWLINFSLNLIVLPWFGLPVTVTDAVGIGLIFTALALVRNYAIRRFFNR